ncbi:phosphoglucomutase-like protein [Dothidotthia symphoricarpi CBS 119687]|uniref:Phosphoglucomutase-like protein n=1 Tax=Dothidotthia symphoricarpi CBS 119687 TaxID=1392245 RepID=A0A6A6AUE5_9PLEO|nr:phosphoglucomutase-like protein [Dothidotthia symphoricarpi CBS 119687]KAF2134467.1 phosphoglucomutase-like protein [Dothidotthia symphoricarpi CBS 119687]
MTQDIQELAREWLELDEDKSTTDEINKLLADGDTNELEKRLRYRIAFGTAGLRGPMQAGFACMNSLTVIQASQGLAAYLLKTEQNVKTRGVVIGRDARHNSEKFARLTAAAFVAKGIKVWWYETISHTPMVPFGVRELNAAAGVMVTASHNPAQDNGYKVYWSNGCQIIPPHDSGIAESIIENLKPVTWDTSVVESSLLVEGSLGLVTDTYHRAVLYAANLENHNIKISKDIRFVYTPMHGVGLPAMMQCVETLGIASQITVVEAQALPDPDFPTVKFPNPEEKGALDLAIETAEKASTRLILASDPDADRLAVAEKTGDKWHIFTGNQLGILIGSYIFERYPASKPRDKLAMLASTVSSRMLAALAKKEGFHFSETLTGFKWLGNIARQLDAQGYNVAYAFEEALGYMIPQTVHDKDSISAAAVFLTAASEWSAQGLTPYAKLQQLYEYLGYFEDANTYLVSPSPAVTTSVFTAVRALDSPHPTTIGSRKIVRWRDLTLGYDSRSKDHTPDLPVDSSSQMITCELDDGAVFTVRGSGTEPKIKLYIECQGKSSEEAKSGANEILQDLLREWFKPEENGLRLA